SSTSTSRGTSRCGRPRAMPARSSRRRSTSCSGSPGAGRPRSRETSMSLHAELALLSGPPAARSRGWAVTRTGRTPGDAPTLVLVHGVGAARLVWAPVLAPLAERYDVVAVDLPGHGASASLPAAADPGCPALAA